MNSPETFHDQVRETTRRIRESGGAALGGLYDLTAVRLVRFAAAITRSVSDAEDAVSAALLKVVVAPELLIEAKSPWAYLLQMVRNEALGILRKRKRWSLMANLSDLWSKSKPAACERAETAHEVWAALKTLPIEQSEVVVLKVWEEMTFLEIAEVLEIPLATAASRYRYALAKLAVQLEPSHGEGLHV